jgi:HK97 family phage major capsid protein
MPYNNLIDRSDAGSLIPEDASREIIKASIDQSAVLTTFRRATMSRKQQRIPALSAFPTAYFVDGDTGLKQTTDVAWANKYLNAEELAAIVPIPEAVLDDADFDIWGEVRPLLAEAIGRAVDAAVFFGTNAPASWPTAILTSAIAAGNAVTYGTNLAAAGGVAADISDTMSLVEADGFDVNGFIARREMRGLLRKARSSDGQKLLDVDTNMMEGSPVTYAMRGQWPAIAGAGAARLFAGDWTQFMCAVRQDLTWKILDQAVIQDGTGAIIYNLAQQDMVALRVVFRVAWQVANPITHEAVADANRYPAAVLRTAP